VKVNQNTAADSGLRIAFHLHQILDGRNPIALNAETTSTHSRTNDSLADRLRENITGAFAVESSRFVTQTSSQISSEGGSGGIRGKTGTRKASGIREGIGAEPPGSPSLGNSIHCHGGPLFHSQDFANNGLDTEFGDSGRKLVTGHEGNKGRFAVPSLRNVEVTGPYMHDGRFKTLGEVVEHSANNIRNP
jgi:hypothetical protein